MKNYFLIAVIAASFTACHQAEVENAQRQNDSLIAVLNERDVSLNDALTTFNDVERNLDSVAAKQHVIVNNSGKQGELKMNSKDRINAEINGINELMDQSRKKIAELNKMVKNSKGKNVLLEKTIATLNGSLLQKEQELVELNARLQGANNLIVQLQTNVESLTTQNADQSKDIAEKTTALHTAYYVIGKAKELEKLKLIDRKGGVLGMGKTDRISSSYDNSKFTKVDYTTLTSIPINSKEVEIVTNHSTDSYTLDKDDKDKNLVRTLTITNPEKFWSSSKHLVIVKD